ncbi:hypothetical protein [Vibrio alginolyticus]
MSERKITASSTSAIYHVCPLNPTEEIIDFADHVKVLSHVLAEMIYNRKPKLIAIEGETGTGKSGLASVLEADGINVVVINCSQLIAPTNPEPVDISDQITDTICTYVIDDVDNINMNSITAINRLVEAGGTVVILCQHRDDLRAPINNAVWLKLDKNGLKIQEPS